MKVVLEMDFSLDCFLSFFILQINIHNLLSQRQNIGFSWLVPLQQYVRLNFVEHCGVEECFPSSFREFGEVARGIGAVTKEKDCDLQHVTNIPRNVILLCQLPSSGHI